MGPVQDMQSGDVPETVIVLTTGACGSGSLAHGQACAHVTVMVVVKVRLALELLFAKMLMFVVVFAGTVRHDPGPPGAYHTRGSTLVFVAVNVTLQM